MKKRIDHVIIYGTIMIIIFIEIWTFGIIIMQNIYFDFFNIVHFS